MHPILGDQLRLRLHLTAWSLAGAMLALLLRVLVNLGWTEALVFGIPMGLLAAPVSLSAWYLVRAMPLARTNGLRIGATALGAAVITSSLWTGAGRLWWQLLSRTGFEMPANTLGSMTLLLGLGVLGYLLAVTVHYVFQASEQSAVSERRALESQIAHRDAELRALRAQIDPHFLFNSLNSVVGLMTSDVTQARAMCLKLAEFLRDSLTLGRETRISLAREVALAEQYLSVERIRFGARLNVASRIDDAAREVPVPPLILQPLVENAVRHGVATLLEGGVVSIDASLAGERLFVVVANPYDADSRRGGTGFGVDIVRRRLAASFGGSAALTAEAADGSYRVSVTMPIER
ncbi:MAG TPA: histidine kinase [Vicinamibacterales bacterium]|nr:histidine kinase [Vicinamibacterales bacterium]